MTMGEHSSINLIFFYMQRSMTHKLTANLCRLAKEEFKDTCLGMRETAQESVNFDALYKMIDDISNNKIDIARQRLGEAYTDYVTMMGNRTQTATQQEKTISNRQSRSDEHGTYSKKTCTGVSNIPLAASTPVASNATDVSVSDLEESYNGDHTDIALYDVTKVDKKDDSEDDISMTEGAIQSVSSLSAGDSEILRLETTKLDPSVDNRLDTMHRSNKYTHLVERFNDLYEKEWSGAFQELSVVLGEKQAARHLLWVIAKASIGCTTHAAQQLEDLEKSVIRIMVSEDPLHKKPTPVKPLSGKSGIAVNRARNLLLKYREALARLSIPILQKGMRDAVASELSTTLPRRFTDLGHSFVEYAEVCTEVIWQMYVHVPPLCLEWLTKEQEGAPFETDLYRAFTRPGTKYDYCVWPIVRLHQGGPVLVKGLAEGR